VANIVSTGGWALVFAVEDIATGKEYALKVSYFGSSDSQFDKYFYIN
jgi:nucleoside-triphosphatase THEP1